MDQTLQHENISHTKPTCCLTLHFTRAFSIKKKVHVVENERKIQHFF